jgi:hypothetical protein
MKQFKLSLIAALLACMVTLNSCQIIGGIFKAGVWVGIFIVVFIVVLIILLISRLGKK